MLKCKIQEQEYKSIRERDIKGTKATREQYNKGKRQKGSKASNEYV